MSEALGSGEDCGEPESTGCTSGPGGSSSPANCGHTGMQTENGQRILFSKRSQISRFFCNIFPVINVGK